MLYYGERKTGCRFLEVYLHGYRTLILENSSIRVMLLIDKGVDIISFVHKPTDTDFVWTNPMGLSCLAKRRMSMTDGDCYSDNYVGGMFEILPNFGEECTYQGMHFPQHSEISNLPFDVQVVVDTPELVELRFTAKLSKYPFSVVKTLILHENSTALCLKEEILNLSDRTLPYLWAFHPCIGAPFLNENCTFELPFAENRTMPKVGAGEDFFDIYEVGKNAFAVIRNRESGLGLALSWDPAAFPYCALWINAGRANGHHRLGGAYVASILPCNSSVMGLSSAADACKAPMLGAGERATGWYTVSAFVRSDIVRGITKEGLAF